MKIIYLFLASFFISGQLFAQPENALDFDGADDMVVVNSIPASLSAPVDSDFTIEAWVNPRGDGFQRILFAQASTADFCALGTSTGNVIYFYVKENNVNYSVGTTTSLTQNTWTHIAATWTTSTNSVQVYFNGVLQPGVPGGNSSTGTNGLMVLGARPGGSQHFNGRLDEVRVWNTARTETQIQDNMNIIIDPSTSGLAAYYRFDQGTAGGNNAGITILGDFTSNNCDGTLTNFALTGSTSNWINSGVSLLYPSGNALDFDGADDMVVVNSIPASLSAPADSNFTIEAWVNPRGDGFQRILFAQASTADFCALGTSTDNVIFFYVRESGFNYSVGTTNSIAQNTWTHIAATWTTSTNSVQIYFNGVLQSGISAGSSSTGTNGLMVLGARPGGSQHFNGRLDEVRVWNTARTETEIQDNMNIIIDPSTPGLAAYYRFDQGTAGEDNAGVTTLGDLTSNNYDGALTNFALTGNNSNWITSAATLPVELTSFTASVSGNSILLNWITATEVNNYGFEVQRKVFSQQSSAGTQEFETIGFVKGNGNSNSVKNYSYSDAEINEGKYSYRLKQIDNDGKYEFSGIIEASFSAGGQGLTPEEFALGQNYPNPFNPSTTIQYSIPDLKNFLVSNEGGSGEVVTLKIYGILGNEIAALVNEVKEPGVYEAVWNAEYLASGVYYYQLKAGAYTSIKKMILLR